MKDLALAISDERFFWRGAGLIHDEDGRKMRHALYKCVYDR